METIIFKDIETAIVFISIIAATILVATITNFILNRYYNRKLKSLKIDITNHQFLKHFVVGLIYMVGIAWALLFLPAFKTIAHTILTGAGIMALVVGLASQQALSNVTSGIFIVIFKPFRIHDRITIREKLTGTVEDITLRHTVVKDLENNRIIIPNSVMGNEIIINAHFSDEKVCRKISIGISYQSDIDRALQIMKDEVKKHPLHINPNSDPNAKENIFAQVVNLSESAVILKIWAWAANENNALIMEGELLKNIKQQFDANGIEIPFPQTVVTLKK